MYGDVNFTSVTSTSLNFDHCNSYSEVLSPGLYDKYGKYIIVPKQFNGLTIENTLEYINYFQNNISKFDLPIIFDALAYNSIYKRCPTGLAFSSEVVEENIIVFMVCTIPQGVNNGNNTEFDYDDDHNRMWLIPCWLTLYIFCAIYFAELKIDLNVGLMARHHMAQRNLYSYLSPFIQQLVETYPFKSESENFNEDMKDIAKIEIMKRQYNRIINKDYSATKIKDKEKPCTVVAIEEELDVVDELDLLASVLKLQNTEIDFDSIFFNENENKQQQASETNKETVYEKHEDIIEEQNEVITNVGTDQIQPQINQIDIENHQVNITTKEIHHMTMI